jgi:ferredoxin
MIADVVTVARELGWSASHIHWEEFVDQQAGVAFDVRLNRSNLTISVPPELSLLEAIESVGVDIPYLCRGGACGHCETTVLELDGELIHNDIWLSDEQKISKQKIMPCVSRARCTKLVLDL